MDVVDLWCWIKALMILGMVPRRVPLLWIISVGVRVVYDVLDDVNYVEVYILM